MRKRSHGKGRGLRGDGKNVRASARGWADTAEAGDSSVHTARCAVLVTPWDKAPAFPLVLDLVILLPHEAWLYCDHCSFCFSWVLPIFVTRKAPVLSPSLLSEHPCPLCCPHSASGPTWASSPPAPPNSCSTALLAAGHLQHSVQPNAAFQLPPTWNPLNCPISSDDLQRLETVKTFFKKLTPFKSVLIFCFLFYFKLWFNGDPFLHQVATAALSPGICGPKNDVHWLLCYPLSLHSTMDKR